MITYLDSNSTTVMLPEVKILLLKEIIQMDALNPSAVHFLGRKAKHTIENARQTIAEAFHVTLRAFDVILTASASEANNTFVKGLPEDTALFISAIEHSSLLIPAKKRKNTFVVNVQENGIIDLQHLKTMLEDSQSQHKVISIILANNETGILQDIEKISELAKSYNALVHSDISQALGKVPFNLEQLQIDAITVASHKIGGPIGAAALIKRKTLKIAPLIEGGEQEHGLRAGTENILAILGFAEATKYLNETIAKYIAQEENRNYLEKALKSIDKDLKIYSQDTPRLPNTLCVASSRFDNETQQMHLDLDGIAISIGSACSSGKIEKSHVLTAMNKDDSLIKNAIRISLETTSTREDINKFIDSWKTLYNKTT